MINKILEFMKKAGETALKNQQKINISCSYKGEEVYSIVTETDVAISDMFQSFIKENFSDLDYVIVDEEKLDLLGGR